MKSVQIKLNKPLKNYKIGAIIKIQVDDTGIPIDRYWFRRMKDCIIDPCFEVLEERCNKKEKKVSKKQDDNKDKGD